MQKFRIHGRGGQGGVTLAKIIAFMYWTKGKYVQAFGSYSAERTGAPLQAFTLIDDIEIANRNQVYYPDHLIILDPTLIGENVLSGLQKNACIIIDTNLPAESFDEFKGYNVAVIDAKKIALKYKLGTKTTPITNTAVAGALSKVFGLELDAVQKTMEALNFPENNFDAAKDAFNSVKIKSFTDYKRKTIPLPYQKEPVPPLVTGNLGTSPSLNIADWKSQKPFYSENNVPPCNFHCPAGNNIQEFIAELANGKFDNALSVLRETSPLPGTTSRICPHPCEDFCNRMSYDSEVNIHGLERLAADRGEISIHKQENETGKKVAIIGSGPAGLSAAYHLRRLGYDAEIFEAHPEPGGMLRAGIPDFRLPKDILQKEIDYIKKTGVKIKCNHPIRSKKEFKKLTEKYDAVAIAIGLSVGRNIGIKGSNDSKNIVQGIEFLKKVNFGEKTKIGKKVIVLGGGNTAFDASRTALRLGAKEVTIIYRRTFKEMPAIKEEIEGAKNEGVKIKLLYGPNKITQKNKKYYLNIQEMKLGETGQDGRRRPIPVSGSFLDVEFTDLILATGQTSSLDFLPEQIKTNDGLIETDGYGMTVNKKVFATGDIVTNDGTVTHAIGEGRKIAISIDRTLRGLDLPLAYKKDNNLITPEQLNLYYFHPENRNDIKERSPEERIFDFKEVNLGIEDINEAFRCFSCGVCNGCYPDLVGKCELFCPERAIHRIGTAKLSIDYENCKGCLICIEVCPREAMDKIRMNEDGVKI